MKIDKKRLNRYLSELKLGTDTHKDASIPENSIKITNTTNKVVFETYDRAQSVKITHVLEEELQTSEQVAQIDFKQFERAVKEVTSTNVDIKFGSKGLFVGSYLIQKQEVSLKTPYTSGVELMKLNTSLDLKPFIPLLLTNDKFELEGLLVDIKESEVSIVATDSCRLLHTSIEQCENHSTAQLILPKPFVKLLQKVNFSSSKWQLDTKDNRLFIINGDTVISSKLYYGQYPNYQGIIDGIMRTKPYRIKSSLPLKKVKSFLNINKKRKKDTIKVSIVQGELFIDEMLVASIEDAGDLAFNIQYGFFESMVSNFKLKKDTIELYFKNAETPLLFEVDNYIYLMMPYRLPKK